VTPVFGKKRRVAAVIVRFSGPVDAAQAASVAEYRLATAGKKGSFDAKNARVISLKSATYDGATFTVTLIPAKAFMISKPVEVQVGGRAHSGLHDSFGRLITGGPDRTPDAGAKAILNRGQ
jgi:hypothetical protein